MSFTSGDRIRHETTGDDGFPQVRYGFVIEEHDGPDGDPDITGPIPILLDGELGGQLVDPGTVQPVAPTTVVFELTGTDLIDEPGLRRGLVDLWKAEADEAGLDVDALHLLGSEECGDCEADGVWCLAELHVGDETYLLRAAQVDGDKVRIGAERPC